ncbi:hypothetical protein P9D34_06005 [Bacillus swezeyi]|nr:hypothetical protein [Bacillus swezeyi]MEC1260007.1 hypothetical protein [Bacillus swezeyi]MED2929761.1 hypothetical protein [Bacillus swezeyi]MED2945454.1 hypothetical protein [Bacillus swezeyi]MED2963212.1 hypothetical protein [Bacillus swezeyi]MED2975852.1 hypothetical protein [Bacillus swezeyi]
MRPIISDELAEAIHEKIIIDLCVHAMETRIAKAQSNQNSGLVDYYEGK